MNRIVFFVMLIICDASPANRALWNAIAEGRRNDAAQILRLDPTVNIDYEAVFQARHLTHAVVRAAAPQTPASKRPFEGEGEQDPKCARGELVRNVLADPSYGERDARAIVGALQKS